MSGFPTVDDPSAEFAENPRTRGKYPADSIRNLKVARATPADAQGGQTYRTIRIRYDHPDYLKQALADIGNLPADEEVGYSIEVLPENATPPVAPLKHYHERPISSSYDAAIEQIEKAKQPGVAAVIVEAGTEISELKTQLSAARAELREPCVWLEIYATAVFDNGGVTFYGENAQ